ncbi:MAG: CD225/dispanin family protein, partial [Bacteroidaceae bacterium]|nr:CD225/dispanin family protein [Bacteroidaceae bacterium]
MPQPPVALGSNGAGIPPTDPTGQCPDNYLVWTILTTILCCWPLGIPGIVYATKVEKLWRAGDSAGAQQAAEQAKMWCFISLGGGVLT